MFNIFICIIQFLDCDIVMDTDELYLQPVCYFQTRPLNIFIKWKQGIYDEVMQWGYFISKLSASLSKLLADEWVWLDASLKGMLKDYK